MTSRHVLLPFQTFVWKTHHRHHHCIPGRRVGVVCVFRSKACLWDSPKPPDFDSLRRGLRGHLDSVDAEIQKMMLGMEVWKCSTFFLVKIRRKPFSCLVLVWNYNFIIYIHILYGLNRSDLAAPMQTFELRHMVQLQQTCGVWQQYKLIVGYEWR